MHKTDEQNDELCKGCALCCTYVTVELPEPKTAYDFEHLLWMLMHKNIGIFIDSEGWYVEFRTVCKELGSDLRCKIYKERPTICRDYYQEECEKYGPEPSPIIFNSKEELVDYMKKHHPHLLKEIEHMQKHPEVKKHSEGSADHPPEHSRK